MNDYNDSKSDEDSNVNQEPENEEMDGNQEMHEDQEVHEETHVVPVSDSDLGNESEMMDEADDDYSNNTNNKSCSNETSTSPDTDEPRNGTRLRIRYEVLSGLGEYWDLQNGTVSTCAADMVLSMITEYSKLTTSPNTPQYGFKKGLHIFEEDRYKATVSELKDNLVGRGCVNMLDKRDVTSDIQKKALAYLMFLKRK